MESQALAEDTTQPPVEHAALTVETTTSPGSQAGWLSQNVRNLLLVFLAIVVSWIAIGMRNERAQETLVVAFVTLAASKAGSSDALKIPGKDS